MVEREVNETEIIEEEGEVEDEGEED